MEIIDELESEKRGVYAGAIGYFSANGSMDTCIALRTAVVMNGTMYVQAGGGIVADSDPDAEFEESRNKAEALIRAAEEAVRFATEPVAADGPGGRGRTGPGLDGAAAALFVAALGSRSGRACETRRNSVLRDRSECWSSSTTTTVSPTTSSTSWGNWARTRASSATTR